MDHSHSAQTSTPTSSGRSKNKNRTILRIENNDGQETVMAGQMMRDALVERYGAEHGLKKEDLIFVTTCDFCRNDILEDEKSRCKSRCNFKCRDGDCGKSFDLCLLCQEDSPFYMSECPAGFGCNLNEYKYSPKHSGKESDDEENDPLFLELAQKPKGEQYEFSGKTINVVGEKRPCDKTDMTYLLEFLQSTGLLMQGGLFYRDGNQLSHNCFADLWLYFRSSDQKCIDKYGIPHASGSITIYNLHSWKLYEFFKALRPLFQQFIELEDEGRFAGKPLGMVFIYPNGDEFYIRRLYGKEQESKKPTIFLTQFLSWSTIAKNGEWSSRWEDPNKTEVFSKKKLPTFAGKTDASKSIYISIGYLIGV